MPVLRAEFCLATAGFLTCAVISNGENGQTPLKNFMGITGELGK
jgi:hypothetical protein